jgi:hypothetical protein
MADREMTNEEAIEILGGIRACYNIFDEYDEPKYAALSKAIFALKAEPTKHGRWLRTDAYPHRIYCSECYATFIRNDELLKLNDIPHDYCPNCGARMDGGEA